MAKKVSGTKEWAASNVNIQVGCSHGCRYCYAKASAIRFGRATPESWTTEDIRLDAVEKNYGKRKGTIMFPTTHDITPGNITEATTVLKKMLAPGNRVLIVSKPHLDCIQKLCAALAPWKDNVLFRFTIGGTPRHLSFWEPGAPDFSERVKALQWAHKAGFDTSVSMEPLLSIDEDEIVRLVEVFAPHVTDAIWLGKMNKPEERLTKNGDWNEETQAAVEELLASQTDERITALYERLKDHPKVKWKESVKAVVGLEIPTEAGLDI